jgi:microcystin-dependent protein
MTEPYLGEIRPFGFNFAPRGWAFCAGQILPIAQNTALFSLLGTTYGGNGQTTFALPDLRGRIPLGMGQGNGLSDYVEGEQTGTETVTLLSTEMASHSHTPYTRIQVGTANMHNVPQAGDYLSRFNTSATSFGSTWNTPPLENATTLDPRFIGFAGGNQPHNNLQPILAINYCIATGGIFPARN